MGSPFRKKAIERLASPEQLDQLLQVTSPATWLSFLSIAVLLVVAIAWSFFGQIPQKTNGIGILMPQGDPRGFSLQEISALKAGLITELSIDEGDRIQKNQIIAQLQPTDIDDQQDGITELQTRVSNLQNEHDLLTELDTQALSLAAGQRDREKAGLQSIITATTANLRHLRTLADDKERLTQSGAITVAESVQAASDVAATEANLNGFQHQFAQQDFSYEQLQLDTNRLQAQRDLELQRLQSQVTLLQEKLQGQSQIHSPFDGVVVQVSAAKGNDVLQGERIALIEQENNSQLRLQGYVAIFTGKDIKAGMLAQISPTTIKREEYGFLNGTVSWISDYPEDTDAILNLVEDQELVNRILQQTEIPLQIELVLTPGRGSQQYSWTTGAEPPQKLSVGVLSDFSIITESKRPIELVIPYIRKILGLN